MRPFPTALLLLHTDWWQPYVPPLVGLAGSMILATVAFVGIVKSNRTNKEAITATDRREWDKWRRETLIKLCTDALGETHTILDSYTDAALVVLIPSQQDTAGDAYKAAMREARMAHARLYQIAYSFDIVGSTDLSGAAKRLSDAADEIREPAGRFFLWSKDLFAQYENSPRHREQAIAKAQASDVYKNFKDARDNLADEQERFTADARKEVTSSAT